MSINKTVAADGALRHETKLTTLVPAMLKSQSPMKSKVFILFQSIKTNECFLEDRAGRLGRPALGNNAKGQMAIGSVAQLVDGPQPDCLDWDRVNNLTLTESAQQAGEYECIMFFQPSAVGRFS